MDEIHYFKIDNKALPDEYMDGTDFIYDSTETIYRKEPHNQLKGVEKIKDISCFDYHNKYTKKEFEYIEINYFDINNVQMKYKLSFEIDYIDENRYFTIIGQR